MKRPMTSTLDHDVSRSDPSEDTNVIDPNGRAPDAARRAEPTLRHRAVALAGLLACVAANPVSSATADLRPPGVAATMTASLLSHPSLGETEGSEAVMTVAAPRWREIKCRRYRAAWSAALARQGPRGLGHEFLERHAAFLASGCAAPADVCPRSPEELALANLMVILAMNAGTASTFPPFACRR